MLAGQTEIHGGEIAFAKGTRIALHDQRPPLQRGLTLREYILSGAADLIAIEQELRRAERISRVETLQPPFSLIDRAVEAEILPFAEREAIGVIVYSPMGSGLLTGSMTRERIEALPDDDWRKRDPRFRDPELARHLELVERLRSVAERHGTTPGAVAAAWTLRHPAVDAAIVGFRRPDQVDPIVVAANLEFGEDEVAAIEGSA